MFGRAYFSCILALEHFPKAAFAQRRFPGQDRHVALVDFVLFDQRTRNTNRRNDDDDDDDGEEFGGDEEFGGEGLGGVGFGGGRIGDGVGVGRCC